MTSATSTASVSNACRNVGEVPNALQRRGTTQEKRDAADQHQRRHDQQAIAEHDQEPLRQQAPPDGVQSGR